MCGIGDGWAESSLHSGINLFYLSFKLFTGTLVFPALALPTLVLPALVLPVLVLPVLVLHTLVLFHTKLQESCALIHTQPVFGNKSDYAIAGLASSS